MVSFDITAAEEKDVRKIARRARALEIQHGGEGRDLMAWQMDITAVHANGNPLRLEGLAEADDFNFAHDVFGICRYLDRDTGKLTGLFSPRYSARA